ncbi:hypothetical protein HDU83_007897 [Entophlyctis luteolus]|nr:hypothetical protein HDU83_007897 [Entophlyctis luteolus]
MIDKRLKDSDKNWRQVYKALVLLDFLLNFVSENVIKYAKEYLVVIKILEEFIYLDRKEHGVNIRLLSKDITAHLQSCEKNQNIGNHHNFRYSGSDDECDRNRQTNRLRLALEESKRTA